MPRVIASPTMTRWLLLVPAAALLAGCGGASTTHRASTTRPLTAQTAQTAPATDAAAGPTVEQVKRWPSSWCEAKPGMTRSQLRALMGPPTGEFSVASGTPQMSWEFAEYHFDAFMNVSDRVRQLDINGAQLSPAERAAIRCETTRT